MNQGDYKFEPRQLFDEIGTYYIKLDKRWKLDEFSEFLKNYEQSYYAAFVIEALKKGGSLSEEAKTSLIIQMSQYPWRGGYSTVHFYYGVKKIIGKKRQPEVQKIRYASPGFIELNAIQDIAINLGTIVASICGSITIINKTYNQIYKGLRDRQLNEISVERARLELEKDHQDFIIDSISKMSEHMNLDNTDRIILASGNEFRALKIILSMYRRIRVVAKYQEDNKISLPKKVAENRRPDIGT